MDDNKSSIPPELSLTPAQEKKPKTKEELQQLKLEVDKILQGLYELGGAPSC